MATVLSGAIMAVKSNTKKTEIKYQQQVKVLEARTRAEQTKQVEDFKKQLEEKDRKYEELKQYKAAERARLASVEASKTPVVSKVVQSIVPTAQAAGGDAKGYIYSHESGNRPGAINASSGACGLGQALPCSKMPCSLIDYACQDTFFTNYMLSRYGTWEAARAFHIAHNWW